MKKRLFPFGLLPGHWGLSGLTRARAEKEYYYEGNELRKEIAKLEAHNDIEGKLAVLSIEMENEEITKQEYDKQVATLKKDPWVSVVRIEMNKDSGNIQYVELDWNAEFIKFLSGKGYVGRSDDEIVNKWFSALCRAVLLQEANDQDYGLQETDDDL